MTLSSEPAQSFLEGWSVGCGIYDLSPRNAKKAPALGWSLSCVGRPPRSASGGLRGLGMQIDFRHGELGQGTVGRLLFFKRGVEQLHCVLVTQLVRPGPE